MKLSVGIDLHSCNSYVGILDRRRKKVFHKRLPNDISVIKGVLKPYRKQIQGVVVESTYNWYWLVDGLHDAGYRTHLANTCGIQKYKGLKHSDDRHDAFWLAEMLMLGILPKGYIYPKEDRPVRDLMRKRMHLVKLKTSLVTSLQNILARSCDISLRSQVIQKLTEDCVGPLLSGNDELEMAGSVSKQTIDFLTRQVKGIEKHILGKVKLREEFKLLKTVPGLGDILALTIMLETGDISRFKQAGNYASFCRKVSPKWTSNDKKKSGGNKKSGNRYLAWAYSMVAEKAKRYSPRIRAYYDRKVKKTGIRAAYNAVAHKLTRSCYHILKKQEPFDLDLFTNGNRVER